VNRLRDWAPLAPLDWIILSTRLLFLAAMPLVAGYLHQLTQPLVYLFILWVGFSLIASLLRAVGWKPRWLDGLISLADAAIGVAVVAVSGSLLSPLWSGLLVGGLRAGLAYGIRSALTVSSLSLASTALVVLIQGSGNPSLLLPIGVYGAVVLGSTLILAWASERLRTTARRLEREQGYQLELARERQRRWVGGVFDMAAEINAALDVDRATDMVLDICDRVLAAWGSTEARLVSALLRVDEDRITVVSARRLPQSDRQLVFELGQGILGRCLGDGRSLQTRQLRKDPALRRLQGLRGCRAVFCTPLSGAEEDFGLLLFGHPERAYFNEERVVLLESIARMASVALQNASGFHALAEEKVRLSEIQEESRKRMARDLHDGPTQAIAAVAMRMNYARRLVERDREAAIKELEVLEEIARSTTKEIRHLLFTLRPLILESQGLAAALYQLADKVRATHGENVIVSAESEVAHGLGEEQQGVVFYIAEEAITNAHKHAEAEHIWVRMHRRGDLFILEVEDDGVGFNVGAVDAFYEQRGSLGMVNMRERAELVEGTLQIKSAEGEGTRVILTVPIRADDGLQPEASESGPVREAFGDGSIGARGKARPSAQVEDVQRGS
jgi:signal transduction histidine kinase